MEVKHVSEQISHKRLHEINGNASDENELKCVECSLSFSSKKHFYKHLHQHIKQPRIKLTRSYLPPLKITLKSKSGNSFEIVHSPTNYEGYYKTHEKSKDSKDKLEGSKNSTTEEVAEASRLENDLNEFDSTLEDINGIIENDKTAEMVTGPIMNEDEKRETTNVTEENYETIPGAEPTPPPDPLPETYPKIRIKTTGLLKESSCTISEVPDNNENSTQNSNNSWSTSVEDPLKGDNDNILSLFNNNERAKDFGFNTSDSEFMPLDHLDNRNSNSLQLSSSGQNRLDNLTGLPMQALAQQVSRLQPSGNSGMHQQNVLINIQQFPQAPQQPQSPYNSPPSFYHHSGQPLYPPPPPPPYPYQTGPIYYPPSPNYPRPTHLQQPPPMNHHQPSPNQMAPPVPQMLPPPPARKAHNNSQFRPGATRQLTPSRPMMRGPSHPQRSAGLNPRGVPPNSRLRSQLVRPTGPASSQVRNSRPPANNNNLKRPISQVKQENDGNVRKKRSFDMLTLEKDEDEDCQVICMQPKNTDGLPQIESVQGGATEPSIENSIMHLSDSITLSVRNPPARPVSPKKSDAKAVANILATRGITVTSTPKNSKQTPVDKSESSKNSQVPPAALNLNGAVSIIPSAKQQAAQVQGQQTINKVETQLPTVDLTDEPGVAKTPKTQNSPKSSPSLGLPYRCYLCPAQYPNALGLSKHRQNYHKTSGGILDVGIPLINLKQPGVLQRLSSLGIHNFIPLPTLQGDGTFALPIINSRNAGNSQQIGATSMLVLGPVKKLGNHNNPPKGS